MTSHDAVLRRHRDEETPIKRRHEPNPNPTPLAWSLALASFGLMRNVNSRSLRWVVFGEVAFLFFMGAGVALHPGYVLARHEGGISEYGVHVKTAVLYTLAWSLLAVGNMRAARACGGCGVRSEKVRKLLLFYSASALLVLVSTYFYSLDAVLSYIHYGFAAVLVVFMSAAAYWLYRQLTNVPWARAALWVQLLGSISALLSIVGALHVLFCAESVSNVGCAILLAKVCSRALDGDVGDISLARPNGRLSTP